MILITGCSGLVGSHLARKYIEEGHKVRAFKRSQSDLSYLNDIVDQIEWIETDLLDSVKIKNALDGIETVIHTAAVVSFHAKDRDSIYETNVIGTMNIVDACLTSNIKKLIYISSIAAIGRTKLNNKLINEDQKWEESKYNSYYAKSKYLGELEVWRAFEEGLDGFIVNPSIILGYGDWNKSSCALFKQVYNNSKFYPEGSMNYVDVSDVSNIVSQLDKKGVNHERYILNARQIKYVDLYQKIAKRFNVSPPKYMLGKGKIKLLYLIESFISALTGKKQKITKEMVKSFGKSYTYDNSKVKKELNYNFRDIEDTLNEVCSAFLQRKN